MKHNVAAGAYSPLAAVEDDDYRPSFWQRVRDIWAASFAAYSLLLPAVLCTLAAGVIAVGIILAVMR